MFKTIVSTTIWRLCENWNEEITFVLFKFLFFSSSRFQYVFEKVPHISVRKFRCLLRRNHQGDCFLGGADSFDILLFTTSWWAFPRTRKSIVKVARLEVTHDAIELQRFALEVFKLPTSLCAHFIDYGAGTPSPILYSYLVVNKIRSQKPSSRTWSRLECWARRPPSCTPFLRTHELWCKSALRGKRVHFTVFRVDNRCHLTP